MQPTGGTPTITKEQQQKHADIETQIKEFFCKGGKVKKVKKGVSGETRTNARRFIDHGKMHKPAGVGEQ